MNSLRAIILRVVGTRVAWPILITIGLLCTTSLFALQLAWPALAARQQLWLLIGTGVILCALLPHFNALGRAAYVFYAIAIVLLVAVFSAPEVQYTHRWFVLPRDVQLQPSELAKIA